MKNQKPSKESLKIYSAFVIDYFPSGNVDVKEDYFFDAVSYQLKQPCTIDDFKVSKKYVGVAGLKVRDVENLYKFIRPKSKEFFVQYFKQVGKKNLTHE